MASEITPHVNPMAYLIQAKIFKPHIDIYIKPLTFLIDKSIKQGIFPDELKIVRVVPNFKSGEKAIVSNYRPISVLNFF